MGMLLLGLVGVVDLVVECGVVCDVGEVLECVSCVGV